MYAECRKQGMALALFIIQHQGMPESSPGITKVLRAAASVAGSYNRGDGGCGPAGACEGRVLLRTQRTLSMTS
jgi:hypothetical protein